MSKFIIKKFVGEQELLDMLELDKKCYATQDQGVYEICKEWLSANSDIYTCVYDGSTLCGYLAFMPITRECYEKHLKGQIKDYQITGRDVLPFTEGQEHYCLLVSLVVDEEYRDGNALVSLLHSFYRRLKDYEKRNIKIKTIIADCVNPRAEEFCQKNGFRQVIKNDHCNIYEGNVWLLLIEW